MVIVKEEDCLGQITMVPITDPGNGPLSTCRSRLRGFQGGDAVVVGIEQKLCAVRETQLAIDGG
jgi:hypothetical protein